MADKADPRPGFLSHLLQATAQGGDEMLGVRHVELNARQKRSITDTLQPAMKHHQRPVTGKKTRHQQDRAAVAVRNAAPTQHRVAHERGHLPEGQRIPELHSLWDGRLMARRTGLYAV
ncbi:MAG: hypothetical protein AUI15_26445 [Actinobacteria bacterium 13_2_20CM_2_66_6]|nr:MAG: hypothetical protein AUI15_26445 [Actinobacteria bacterium 13_2_20CM_2_66_6]